MYTHTHTHTTHTHTHTCTRTHTNTHAHTHTQTNIFTQFSGADPEKLVVKMRHFLESKGAHSPGKGHRCELGEGGEGRVRVASYPGHVVRGKSGLVSTVCACVKNPMISWGIVNHHLQTINLYRTAPKHIRLKLIPRTWQITARTPSSCLGSSSSVIPVCLQCIAIYFYNCGRKRSLSEDNATSNSMPMRLAHPCFFPSAVKIPNECFAS